MQSDTSAANFIGCYLSTVTLSAECEVSASQFPFHLYCIHSCSQLEKRAERQATRLTGTMVEIEDQLHSLFLFSFSPQRKLLLPIAPLLTLDSLLATTDSVT